MTKRNTQDPQIEPRVLCSRCGGHYLADDPVSAWDHAPDAPGPRVAGRPPKAAYTTPCRATAELRGILSREGVSRMDSVLSSARGALGDVEEALATKVMLDRLEEYFGVLGHLAYIGGMGDMGMQGARGNAPRSLFKAAWSTQIDSLQGEVGMYLSQMLRDMPADLAKEIRQEEDEIILSRLRIRAPAIITVGPSALAYWSISTGFEEPIIVRGMSPRPSPPEWEEFGPPARADARPYVTEAAAARDGAEHTSAVTKITADRLFGKRVERWKYLLGRSPSGPAEFPGNSPAPRSTILALAVWLLLVCECEKQAAQ
jgi:hypothetical protein